MLIRWTGDDFSNTASLVEAVLTLQEQRNQRPLADVLPPQSSALPGVSHVENVAAETVSEPRVSVMESERQLDASTSVAAAGFSADVNG